ncbi:MAG TPA: ABC transporter permease subunit [Vicinamibacterales bacterium]|nr:ABC transporter permease subunit [Vicinamibacterales bacterium]
MSTTGSTVDALGRSQLRRHMAASTGRIRRLKQIDRLAVGIITLGGIAVIVSVIGILAFIGAEAVPLFRSSQASLLRSMTPAGAAATTPSIAGRAVVGVDESRRFVYAVESPARLAVFAADSGARLAEIPVTSLAGAGVTTASRSLEGDLVAIGTGDGRAALVRVQFPPPQNETDAAAIQVVERGLVTLDPAGRPIQRIDFVEQDDRQIVAALVSDREVVLRWTDSSGATHQVTESPQNADAFTTVAVGRHDTAVAGTRGGSVYHWELGEQATLTDIVTTGSAPVTAIGYIVGHRSIVAGTGGGGVSVFFRAPVGADESLGMVRSMTFDSQGAAVTAIAASTRDRSFATAGADGSVVVRHQTSGRTLVRLDGTTSVAALTIAPRSDAVLVGRESHVVDQFALANPHPEVSWHTLFGRVWYEGYPQPEYVWQSTGATDDFEPKISLVPLVFGTIKGTVYALLFAVPLAIFGALYTSQFVHPRIRARIKPTVEIMAALPSVVIGFVGGLYLAPLVERNLVASLLLIIALPVAGTSGALLWNFVPPEVRTRLRTGTELLVIVPLLIFGGWLALMLAPGVEAMLFRGNARQWMSDVLGITYDQRNSLVVGLAMGFAVIPIIFTIAEDAFSSVPSNLSAASLAVGASRWQTAVRVVVPTASPGVFSAVMVGFGRAVGETMIVLMATGNTPVLDWSMFNGFRTLSANIAVEIPEAPQGGSLYRVLFLSAALLFLMTFTVNTVAEVIRQRLRNRFKAI